MKALRKVVEVNKNQVNLRLSVNFDSKYVEIIVLPFYEKYVDEQNNDASKEFTDFQSLLLSAPVMTDDEYNYFLQKKQNFNKWK
ncbi:MAG: hypothetical protein JEY97_13880 [Bacteroidales bacterium]|nr:hypothetical protein [Bacteroidales bacterium]